MIAVTLFGDVAPEHFGVFDVALLTLFYVTAGEPWPEDLPVHHEDGSANWIAGAFTMAFTIVVHWVVLEVTPSSWQTGPGLGYGPGTGPVTLIRARHEPY